MALPLPISWLLSLVIPGCLETKFLGTKALTHTSPPGKSASVSGGRDQREAGSRVQWLDRVWNAPVRWVACVMEYELMGPRSLQLP